MKKRNKKLQEVYRDHLNNPIVVGDLLIFTSIKQCRGLMMGRVISFTPKRVRVENLETKQRVIVATKHCTVITQQINYNLSEPVDGYFEDVSKKTGQGTIGQAASRYLTRRGFRKEKDGKWKHKDEDKLNEILASEKLKWLKRKNGG